MKSLKWFPWFPTNCNRNHIQIIVIIIAFSRNTVIVIVIEDFMDTPEEELAPADWSKAAGRASSFFDSPTDRFRRRKSVIPPSVTRWRAYMILKPIPADERPSLHLKIFAAEALRGQRSNWGSDHRWEGNYLGKVRHAERRRRRGTR